jgi:hypothetical protein
MVLPCGRSIAPGNDRLHFHDKQVDRGSVGFIPDIAGKFARPTGLPPPAERPFPTHKKSLPNRE